MLTCNIRYLNKLVDIVVSVLTFRADKIVSIGLALIANLFDSYGGIPV